MAQWLSTLCNNYALVIDNDKITHWRIKNRNDVVLEFIESNKYHEAISELNIESKSTENKHECMVCHDEPSEIIELPCHHTLCLGAVVRFNIINDIKINKCFYCQKEYQWSQCKSLETR